MLAFLLSAPEAVTADLYGCLLSFTTVHRMKSEIRDGLRIDWDAPIEMDDGLVLRADVFRPIVEDRHPVILSYGPYAKGLAFQEGYKSAWRRLSKAFPEAVQG
jgi:predicted acyl esterase